MTRVVISIDLELGWGKIDAPHREHFRSAMDEVPVIVERLLALFRMYDAPVTWAVVGALLEQAVGAARDPKELLETFYPGMRIPDGWIDTLVAPEVVELVLTAVERDGHELASHSYSHVTFDPATLPRDTAQLDLSLAADTIRRAGRRVHSLVYPRNVAGYRQEAADVGFASFRGRDATEQLAERGRWRRYLHYFAAALNGLKAPDPSELGSLQEISSTMPFFFPSIGGGLRRVMPSPVLLNIARRSLLRAEGADSVFHFWFHPFNFAHRQSDHFRCLEDLLHWINQLRAADRVKVVPMAGIG